MTERIEALKKKQEMLTERIRKLEAQERLRERKRDTRRKVLVGSMILAAMERNAGYRAKMIKQFDRYLTRDIDRALFDLAPLAENTESAGGGK